MRPETIKVLKDRMQSLETIPANVAFDMLKALDKMPPEGLEAIVVNHIKFLTMPAISRLVADHGYDLFQIDDLRKERRNVV